MPKSNRKLPLGSRAVQIQEEAVLGRHEINVVCEERICGQMSQWLTEDKMLERLVVRLPARLDGR